MFRPTFLISCFFLLSVSVGNAQSDPKSIALQLALNHARASDWEAAGKMAARGGQVARDIVDWQRLRAGEGTLGEYEDFLRRRSDWPGLPYLKRAGETAVARSSTPTRIIAYFGSDRPQTAKGATALIWALKARGEAAKAEAEARRAWSELSFNDAEQTEFLSQHEAVVHKGHAARLERLLWRGDKDGARRMLPLVTGPDRLLAEARLGLMNQVRTVDTLIAAVPADRALDPGLAYDRFVWRFTKDRYDDASALLQERSTSAEALGDPEAWAWRRAALARREMRVGDPGRAYQMASRHYLTEGSSYADLEWLAGYIALRKLSDPETALRHFQRLRAAVNTPISLGRAGYWEGLAQEALNKPEAARAAFAYGAEFQSGFYGLLAAERAGLGFDTALLGGEKFPDWRGAAFMKSSVLDAALLLQKAGDRTLSKRFFLHLAEGLGATELGQLADLALSLDEPHIAVLIAKQAADRGVILPRAYFPMTELTRTSLPVPTELALAIARRESEFDPAAVSPAGARGLMQVMPGTAKLMAEKTGVSYVPGQLSDGAYNAQLGSAYLAQLIEEFGPALTLVTAGYNAGPGRPRSWLQELGDPRNANVDPVDWIEHIPFTETRNYVMRVSESLMIYRAKLAGGPVPLRLTDALKGR